MVPGRTYAREKVGRPQTVPRASTYEADLQMGYVSLKNREFTLFTSYTRGY